MKKLIESLLVCFLFCSMHAQTQYHKGYPARDGSIDIKANFVNPPKGYGNVPFYWWNGDSLKKERLADQLQILSEAPIDGFSVSYIHSHPLVDTVLNKNGYGGFGKPDSGIPGVFTEDWWKMWNWFSGRCADKEIGLGLDDYVVGWSNNGYYVDELRRDSAFASYQGRLKMAEYQVGPYTELDIKIEKTVLSVMAYPAGENLNRYIKDGRLVWKSASGQPQTVYVVYTIPSYELHPSYGKRLVEVYFQRFEDKLDTHGREGLNYFFQDELHYDLNIHSWAEDMPVEFKKRKGYDILPYLPALFTNIGKMTPKIRLDYADVVTCLSEDRYFKPVFDWHNERGLIYGCDNNGRGLEPLQYLDYFRMISWFTAPGNDAPARGSSFRQTKVSSSIAHLYKRPRTWLEAFHSMGWDSNGEWLTSQLDHHIIAGGNLLCLHGLYYSTHGGWWEWAPPCFHFRMPYWSHMKHWLKYAERLSFVLSQGLHVCDIAVLYPTESTQAYPGTTPEMMWRVTDCLSDCGLDYDYIDFRSLQNATVEDGCLSVSGEKYKVLVLADSKAMHYETLLKVLEFAKKGGIIIALGNLPQATSRVGEGDPELEMALEEIFERSGKGFIVSEVEEIPSLITRLIVPDFMVNTKKGKVLHRRIGDRDVYMVMDIKKGAEMFFRCKGMVERWDAMNGKITALPVLCQTSEGTWIRFDGEGHKSEIIVFSSGTPVYENQSACDVDIVKHEVSLDGDWDIEVVPTMNNKWGDFRLPATDEMIGPEAREFTCRFVSPDKGSEGIGNIFVGNLKTIYGFAPYMETVVLDSLVDIASYLQNKNYRKAVWKPYCYSWQYGVCDNPGSEGYHGLKGKVDDSFLILDQGGHQLFKTSVYAPYDGVFRIEQEGVKPGYLYVDESLVTTKNIKLSTGWHDLLIVYPDTPRGSYVLSEKKSYSIDNRKRSAIVFYPSDYPDIKPNSSYGDIVAMKWYRTGHLDYSVFARHKGEWLYRFETAPGTKTMHFNVGGKIRSLSVNGKKYGLQGKDGGYILDFGEPHACVDTVTLCALPDIGYDGAAFFKEPVKLSCGKGRMSAGNWSNYGALKFFSGGICYSKSVSLSPGLNEKIELDLGMVDATCEVKINGRYVDCLINPPYKIDITDCVKEGVNRIEVLVYSSLSNHYQSIPSAYRGIPCAGLLGPVRLVISKKLFVEIQNSF